jgi:L-tartrate/succinate antiporter
MPSNTARSGGTIYPIIKNIPEIFDSRPGETSRKMGAYLMWVGMATCAITSTLFLTANAPNLLGLELVSKTLKISVSWREWFLGVLPLGAALFLLVPFADLLALSPANQGKRGVQTSGRQKPLAKWAKISGKELMMALLAFVALLLWIFADKQINPTMVAIIVFVLMILTGVITWDDVLSYRQAWNMLIWFGTLVALADGLKTGWLPESGLRHATSGMMQGLPIMTIVVLMVAVYFLVHYMFASLTAHATALLPVFLGSG